MRDQHRLRALQMRVGGHGRSRLPVRPARAQVLSHSARSCAYLVDRGPHVKPQVGRDLLVAAAARCAACSPCRQSAATSCFSTKWCTSSASLIVEKCRGRRSLRANLLQALKDCDQLARRQYAGILQRGRMRAGWRPALRAANAGRSRNDRCQRSKSASSGWRNRPDHIFIGSPQISSPRLASRREAGRASATAARECG